MVCKAWVRLDGLSPQLTLVASHFQIFFKKFIIFLLYERLSIHTDVHHMCAVALESGKEAGSLGTGVTNSREWLDVGQGNCLLVLCKISKCCNHWAIAVSPFWINFWDVVPFFYMWISGFPIVLVKEAVFSPMYLCSIFLKVWWLYLYRRILCRSIPQVSRMFRGQGVYARALQHTWRLGTE